MAFRGTRRPSAGTRIAYSAEKTMQTKTSAVPITLGRCLLAGLMTGIVSALLVIIFNVIYRREEQFIAYAVVMPISVFMAVPFFHLVAGGFYYLFIDHLKKGSLVFTLVSFVLTLVVIFVTEDLGSKSDSTVQTFRGLLVGIEIIGGLLTAVLIPWLVRHPTLFLTPEDIKGEE